MKKRISKKEFGLITPAGDYSGLLGGISKLMEEARRASARAVNAFILEYSQIFQTLSGKSSTVEKPRRSGVSHLHSDSNRRTYIRRLPWPEDLRILHWLIRFA